MQGAHFATSISTNPILQVHTPDTGGLILLRVRSQVKQVYKLVGEQVRQEELQFMQ